MNKNYAFVTSAGIPCMESSPYSEKVFIKKEKVPIKFKVFCSANLKHTYNIYQKRLIGSNLIDIFEREDVAVRVADKINRGVLNIKTYNQYATRFNEPMENYSSIHNVRALLDYYKYVTELLNSRK